MQRRLYKNVAANTVERDEYVVADGQQIIVKSADCNAGSLFETTVRIVWDRAAAGEEILLSTHGDCASSVGRSFTGNGVKKLTIELDNSSSYEATLGGSWTAVLV